MEITLYKNNAENVRVDKTNYIEEVLTATGTMREECDVSSPTFVIELPYEEDEVVSADDDSDLLADDDDVVLTSLELLDFNYAYIPSFRRYYFIRSVTAMTAGKSPNHLYRLVMVCDELMSFKDHLMDLNGYISRNEFDYNAIIPDDMMPLAIIHEIEEDYVSTGASVNFSFKTDMESAGDRNIVIGVTSTDGYYKTDSPLDSVLPSVETGSFGDAGGVDYHAMDSDNFTQLVFDLMGDWSAYSSFFVSAVAFPYIPDQFIYPGNISIYKPSGDQYELVELNAQGALTHASLGYQCIADFYMPTPTSFLDFEPYSVYRLWIPFVGWRDISMRDTAGHRILIYYAIDQSNGSAECYIFDKTKKTIIESSSCQLGIPLSLTSTNKQENDAKKNAMDANLALSLISSAISLVGSAYSGNAVGVGMSLLGGAKAITDYNNQNAMMIPHAQVTHNGANGGIYSPLKVRLKKMKSKSLVTDTARFNHAFGKPLLESKYLRDLTGFTIVGEIHLENLPAYDAEKTEIETLLKSGVIF